MSNSSGIQESENHIAVFQEAAIRRTWHNEEWWFSVVDVCDVLTASLDAGAYWRKLKQRLVAEGGQPVTFCHGLNLKAHDGKLRGTDCANTEGLFRLIQSIPSAKAEPFKRWLAQVGYERVKEIENPELASARARELYEVKATFGVTPAIHSQIKGLDKVKMGNNLRDHITDLKLLKTACQQARAARLRGMYAKR